MLSKKRKADEPPAGVAAAARGDVDEFEPLPTIGRRRIDEALKEADQSLAAIEQNAKQMRRKLREQAAMIRGLITSNGGQPSAMGQLDEEIEVNVGGTVLCVPRKPLLLPGVSESVIAYLLLYHLEGLPKDTDGRPFLDADPVYVDWLFDEIAKLFGVDAQGETAKIELTGVHATDSSSLFWHDLLFASKTSLDIDMPADAPTPDNDDHDNMQVDDEQQQQDGEEEGENKAIDGMATFSKSIASLDASVGWLGAAEDRLKHFYKLVKPLLASGVGQGDEIRSVRVGGKTVSTTEATLSHAGRDKRLYTTFHDGAAVHATSSAPFMKVVDFARRKRITQPASLVMPPTASNARQMQVDTEMYGLKHEPFCSGLAGGNLVIETAEEWNEVLKMTGKTSPKPSLIYRGSRDTYAYPKMLQCVAGKSGLLFALRDGDTHRFGCFIDGELTPPQEYKVPTFFYSLSGAYDTPTKIELPEDRQTVAVAGTQGAVMDKKREPLANVYIGRGYLWLGFAEPGPAADLSSCHQWIAKDELLPLGYKGNINQQGNGTLAQSNNFTASEIEIWHITEGGSD
ncbi:unnamed protein product [Vitrella brassicaformis CCMP3155]|uniref:TLDc domain-containing protein n=1 Tax=Vitrella brassicaformis (strain CCMP3155) TaxID=1169540 RepID=A0A0G4FDU1_VITBC|nr:unnamed protein product [Vitrella brassicaformis CCMP3155]|eukprot:CEM11359.1 unnamed protein product [Vitrella brassicaformis CCMP3155]